MRSIEWLCCRWYKLRWPLSTLNHLNYYILRCLMHLRNWWSQRVQIIRVRERHCSLVRVSSVAAKLCQNGSDMVRLACKSIKADHVRPLSHSQQWQHFSCSFSPRPRRYTGRQTQHEAAYQQRSNNPPLSFSPSTPGSSSCWIWCHSATCACSSHVAHWLLQRRACSSPSCDNWTTCTCPESGGSACSTSRTTRLRDECVTAAALATHQSTNHI